MLCSIDVFVCSDVVWLSAVVLLRLAVNIIVLWHRKKRTRRRPPTTTIKNQRSAKPTSTIKSKPTSATSPPITTKSPSKSEEEATESSIRYLTQDLGHKHSRKHRSGVRNQNKFQHSFPRADIRIDGISFTGEKQIKPPKTC